MPPSFIRWLFDRDGESPYIKRSRLPYEEATTEEIDAMIAAADADPDEADDDDDDDDDEE